MYENHGNKTENCKKIEFTILGLDTFNIQNTRFKIIP